MNLRDRPVVTEARLPGGHTIEVRVVVPSDPYIARHELTTVVVELRGGDEVEASVVSPLGPENVDEARELAGALRLALEEGTVEPTAAAIEPIVTGVLRGT